MWKRIVIRLAFRYLTRLFMKWISTKQQAERDNIAELLASFEQYLRTKDAKTTTLIADLLTEWRD